MAKRNLRFIYDNKYPQFWCDGLFCALKELEKDFDIQYQNLAFDEQKNGKYDFVLGWGGFGGSVDEAMTSCSGPRGLCLAGNAIPPISGRHYDVIFYETDWVREFLQLDNLKTKLVKAFGINDAIFAPLNIATPVIWDYIGVGALANWKRWEKMATKTGNRLVIGEYQRDNEKESLEIASNLLKMGVMVSPMVHPFDLANYYHWSRVCFISADIYGGGERAVMEARSCGTKVEVCPDNPKLVELLNTPIVGFREYAKQLKKGIESVP
jgi:hypothetical protein